MKFYLKLIVCWVIQKKEALETFDVNSELNDFIEN